jgi:hypothetical protein
VFFGYHRLECFTDRRLRSRRAACSFYPLPFNLYPLTFWSLKADARVLMLRSACGNKLA